MATENRGVKRTAALQFFRIGLRDLWARITGTGERRQAALDYVRAHAQQGHPQSVLDCLDTFGRSKRFLMNIGDEKSPLLVEQVKLAGDEPRILELGAYVGYSAVLMSAPLTGEAGLTSLEKDPFSADISRQMVEFAGLTERVEVLTGDSKDLIGELHGQFDLVLLDHWKGLYQRDLKLLVEHGLLKKGCIVFADNVGPMFNAEEFLDYFRNCGQFETRHVEAHVEYSTIPDAVEIGNYLGTD